MRILKIQFSNYCFIFKIVKAQLEKEAREAKEEAERVAAEGETLI